MKTSDITESAVHRALSAIRSARSLESNPMLELRLVEAFLLARGLDDGVQNRSWALVGTIEALVHERMAQLRGLEPVDLATDEAPRNALREWQDLRADLASDDLERRAWGLLQYHYFSIGRRPLGCVVEEMGVPRRTLTYRLKRGRLALTEFMREREHFACRSMQSRAMVALDGDRPDQARRPVLVDRASNPELARSLLEIVDRAPKPDTCAQNGERYVDVLVRVEL